MLNKNFERSKETSLEKFNEIIKKIEEKTQLKSKHLYIILITSFTLIWFGILDIYISYLLTIYFQAIWTLKVIYKKEMEGDKQWLSYWVIFAMFRLLDMFSGSITSVIPFYFLIRTTILLWLSLPGFRGALNVYNLLFVQVIKISRRLKILEMSKVNTIKAEMEEVVEESVKKESEIMLPDLKKTKK